MSINISQFSRVVEHYLNKLGRPITVKKSDNSEDSFFAVIEQTWKKNKSKFEDSSSMIGRADNEYYEYFGPADYDITELTKNDYVISDGRKYFFVKTEKVVVGGFVQYYTGILKRIFEEDGNVFN